MRPRGDAAPAGWFSGRLALCASPVGGACAFAAGAVLVVAVVAAAPAAVLRAALVVALAARAAALDEPEPEADDELEDGAGALDEENDCGALAGVAVVVGREGLEEAARLDAAVEPEPAAPRARAARGRSGSRGRRALVGDAAAALLSAVGWSLRAWLHARVRGTPGLAGSAGVTLAGESAGARPLATDSGSEVQTDPLSGDLARRPRDRRRRDDPEQRGCAPT